MIAQFIRFYGGQTYRDRSWPTRDRVIPQRTFLLLLGMIEPLVAKELLELSYGVTLGAVQVMDGKAPSVKKAMRELKRQATPPTVSRGTLLA